MIESLSSDHPITHFKPVKTVDDLVMGELTLGESDQGYIYRKRFDSQQITVNEIARLAKKARQSPSLLYYPKIVGYSTLVSPSHGQEHDADVVPRQDMVDGMLPHESSLRVHHDDFIDKDRLSYQPAESSLNLVREVYFLPNELNLRSLFHRRLSEGQSFLEEELLHLIFSVSKVR